MKTNCIRLLQRYAGRSLEDPASVKGSFSATCAAYVLVVRNGEPGGRSTFERVKENATKCSSYFSGKNNF